MRKRKKIESLLGLRFNRLTVKRFAGYDTRNSCVWECLCDCGNSITTRQDRIKGGMAKSCGCLQKEKVIETGHKNRTHGLCGSSFYRTWTLIIQRCRNPKNPSFQNYGGRGISVCSYIASSAENFYNLMGSKPYGQTVDRIDNESGYTCGSCAQCHTNGWTLNVRWASRTQQARNKRNNRFVEISGVRKVAAEWAETCGVPSKTIYARFRRGLSGSDLIKPLSSQLPK